MTSEPRAALDLLRAARGRSVDDDERWRLVAALHRAPTREVFQAAVALCGSREASDRLLGVDVLGQLGVERRPFRDEALPVLLARLADPVDAVAAAAGVALGHHADVRAVAGLAATAAHPSADVRLGVVHGLSGLEDPRAIDTLVSLSADPDPAVRDWAVFGLGTQVAVDTPAVRDALRARARDTDPDTRAEALLGLARRGDPEVVALLREARDAGLTGDPLDEAEALAGAGGVC